MQRRLRYAGFLNATADLQSRIAELGPWFYDFDLGNGIVTPSAVPAQVRPIFRSRLEMVESAIIAHFGARLKTIRCLDIGCHEGFYAIAMARQGVREVVGVDVREESLARARFIARTLNVPNIRYEHANCEEISPEAYGRFELTLFLGVLYHLENPMLCLRRAAAVTTELCVVETQVIDEVDGAAEWGAREWTRPYSGVLAVIDESGEYRDGNTETGATPLATCPSPCALRTMLAHAGFCRVELIEPPPGAYEQLARRKRVVCAAWK